MQFDSAIAGVTAPEISSAIAADNGNHSGNSLLTSELIRTANAVALQPWRAALAARDLAPANFMLIGDSDVEGYGATQMNRTFARRIVSQVAKKRPLTMQTGTTYTAPTQPIGGRGFIPSFHYAGLTPADRTEGCVTTGGAFSATAGFGVNLNYWTASAAGNQAYSVIGDFVRICMYAGPGLGVLSWQVDGGAATQINCATIGSSNGFITALIPLGAAGAHTFQINWVSGTIFINGIIEYNGDSASGINAHCAGFVGTSALSYANSATATVEHAINANCSLFAMCLGINDANSGGRTPAQFQADMTAMYAWIRAFYNTFAVTPPTMLHIIEFQPSATVADPVDGWAAYVKAAYAAAATDKNACVLDLSKRMPPATVSGAGTIYFDGAHPNDTGHALVADIVSDFLALAA